MSSVHARFGQQAKYQNIDRAKEKWAHQLLNKYVPHGVGVAQLLPVLGVLSFCHCLCSLCGDET